MALILIIHYYKHVSAHKVYYYAYDSIIPMQQALSLFSFHFLRIQMRKRN